MRKCGALLAISMLAVLAGCSSGGGSVSPGNSSPKAAVDGYITDLLSTTGSGFCSYLEPSQQSGCDQLASEVHAHATGTWAFGNESIQGDKALVVFTGDICLIATVSATTSNNCDQNTDPNKGLPSGSLSFGDAYSTALSATNGAITCIEINGLWWVTRPNLVQGSSGSSPATTSPATTSPATTTATTSPATTTATTSPATTTPDTSPDTTVPDTSPETTTPDTTG